MKIKASWGPLKAWGPRGSIPCSPFPPWWACMLGTLMVNITPNMCSLHKECLHPFQRSEIWVRVSVGVKWYQQQFLMEQTHHLLHLQMGRVGLQNMSGHACRKKKKNMFLDNMLFTEYTYCYSFSRLHEIYNGRLSTRQELIKCT